MLPEKFAAKGLDKVEAQLKVDAMNVQEKITYEAHLKNLAISKSMLETAKLESKLEEKVSLAIKLLARGMDKTLVLDIVGLTEDEFNEGNRK